MDHQELLSTLLKAETHVGKARRAVELFLKDGSKDNPENNSVERSQSGLTNSKSDTSSMSHTIIQTAEYTKSGVSTMIPVSGKRKLVNTIPRDVNFASEIDVSLSKRPRTNVVDSERIEVIDLTQEYANGKSSTSTMGNGVAPMKLSLGISSILGVDDTNTPLNLCLKSTDEKRSETTLYNIISNVSQRVQEIDVNLLSVSATSTEKRSESASTDSGSLDERRNSEEIVNLPISHGPLIESWEWESNKDKVVLSGKENAEKSKIGIEDDQGTDEHDTCNEIPCFNDDANGQENEILRNDGTDVDEEKADNEHAENCNGDNLTDTEGRVNNRKHLSSTSVDNENCDSTSTTEKSLAKHKRIRKEQKLHNYDICDKQLVYKHSLVSHLRTHTERKQYTCAECNKSFGHRSNLSRHMRIHSGEKPYNCTECNKSFRCNSTLSYHMRIHRREKPYSCSVCNKSFRQKGTLSRHMKIHSGKLKGENPYHCLVCKKLFSEKGNLSVHMRIHRDEKPYRCSLCKKLFSQKVQLSAHMRIHRGEKPYSCSECNKSFRHSGHLSVHMRIHRGEKPYTCSECNKSFRHKITFSLHMRINNGVRCTYTCYYCGTNYVRKKDLKDHCVQCYKLQSVGT